MINKDKAISVEDLRTYFFTKEGSLKAVDGVSFSIEPGKIVGLVGESGSGKSVTGLYIMGLIDEPGRVVSGRIIFRGDNLLFGSLSVERFQICDALRIHRHKFLYLARTRIA